MNRRVSGVVQRAGGHTRIAVALALIVVLNAMSAGLVVAADPTAGPADKPSARSSTPLSDGRLRDAVERDAKNQPLPKDLKVKGEKVLVEVIYVGSKDAAERTIEDLRGEVNGYAGTDLLQAFVPVKNLVRLEKAANVTSVRAPIATNVPLEASTGQTATSQVRSLTTAAIVGQEVTKTNAAAWQAAGITGAGIKVGIIDQFSQAAWNAAIGAGEVVAPAGTFCRINGASCSIFGGSQVHGVAVTEIIHEMAPGAQIYLATVLTTSDLQAAVNYFAGQGVKIITRSLGSQYEGPGNGTGANAQVVTSAVSQGMAWFNSSGNSGKGGSIPGGYWRGSWSDPDADGWLNWSGGGEALQVNCGFIFGLRWSDWGANRTDYDAYLYDNANGTGLKASSLNDQAAGASPIEWLNPTCGSNDIDYLWVKLFSAGSGTAGDVLEFQAGAGLPNLGLASNYYAAAVPVVDSASAGAIAVGAIDPWNGTTIAPYSSWGPTNDNRVKPDLSAASCFSSFTYSPGCFDGTSAAAPTAAGAAALVLQAGLASTPTQLKTYLMTQAAAHDRGAAGIDYTYGAGELILPAPPVGKPTAPGSLTATPLSQSSIRLNWADSTGETSYTFFQWSGTAWANIGTGAQNQITVTVNGLNPATLYYFHVCANNAAGQTCAASYVSATTLGNTKPTAPGSLAATPLSQSSIRLNWTDSTGETSYTFFQWSGTAWANIGTGAQNQITVTVNGLNPATLYYFYVCANNAAGQTCPASYVSATTLTASKPTAPGNLAATPISQSSIRLNWTDSTGETSYTFYRWSGTAWVNIATGAENQTVYTDSTIVTPGLYYYDVCANNASGQTCAPYVSANNSVS